MSGRLGPIGGVVALCIVSIVVGCTSAPPTPSFGSAPSAAELSAVPTNSPPPSATAGASSAASGQPSAAASPSSEPAEAPPTSEELIAEALASSKIDLETSLRYRAFALYADPRLPAEYQSPVMDYEAAAQLSLDVAANADTLSAAAMAEIAPFIARPNDPMSVFNSIQTPAAASARGSVALAQTAAVDWVSEPAAGGKARVWMKNGPGAEISLQAFDGAVVSPIWPKLLQFFRAPLEDDGKSGNAINPDPAIDIYMVDFNQVDPRQSRCAATPTASGCTLGKNLGQAPTSGPRFDNKSSGYVLVKATLDTDTLRATVAHELFHDAQDAFDNNELHWLNEATATWGEFRILRELGWTVDCGGCAHGYLSSLFPSLDQPLTFVDGQHEYGAYLYFYFAQMEKGDDTVFDIWGQAAAAGQQGETAVDPVVSFRDNFPKFALRNWNAQPVEGLYREPRDPTFPELHPASFDQGVPMKADSLVHVFTAVQPLGIKYYHYEFSDPAVRSVIFRNALTGQPDAAVQALVRLPDGWQKPRDWTHTSKETFCRDKPDQDVRELVLIVSNSGTQEELQDDNNTTLEAKSDPCTNWAGTIQMTYTNNMSFPGFVQEIELDLSGFVSWVPDAQGLHNLEGSTVYLPADGSITWQEHGRFGNDQLMCTISGGGTYPIRRPEDYRFYSSLEVATDPATGVSRYVGIGLEPPDTQLGDVKVSCGTQTPPFPEDLAASWLNTGNSADPDGGVKQSDANGALTGTYVSDSSNQGTGIHTWTWSFQPSP